ncbi:hypothetical protein [Nocardioides rubriscoriae]|uniref:hypothetical protein n=1 Tax=Nocardioides rubriscoriae TaxID=642762 RepID=UPI0011DF8125|nr:hypothetical protein [Nocardioides rubriscoriae]
MTEHPPTPRRGDDTNTTPDVDRVDSVGLIDCARHAEDALRQLARLTHPGPRAPGLTPAEVDTALSHLAEAIAAVPQVASQLGAILDQSRHTHLLAMDHMTATTDPDLAVDAARCHLDALRSPAVQTYRHLNAARNEAAHICAHPLHPADRVVHDIAGETYPPLGIGGAWRREEREAPRPSASHRSGPAR